MGGQQRRSRPFATSLLSLFFPFFLVSCDQVGERFQSGDKFELSKDEKGRTLRLNKRTGEIAIIENGRIISLKDAKEEDRQEAEKIRRIGQFKYWNDTDIPQFKLVASLTTVWRDGRALYSVSFRPMQSKPEKNDKGKSESSPKDTSQLLKPDVISKFESHTFFLLLSDVPFELARETLVFSQIVNSEEKPIGWDAKSSIAMSRESYEKLDSWNIQWRRRF